MSPRFDNRKTLKVIKPAIAGPLVWFYQGERPQAPIVFTPIRPAVFPQSFVSLAQFNHANECEPARLLLETEDSYINRLYHTPKTITEGR